MDGDEEGLCSIQSFRDIRVQSSLGPLHLANKVREMSRMKDHTGDFLIGIIPRGSLHQL